MAASTWVIARAQQLPPGQRAGILLRLTVLQIIIGGAWCWRVCLDTNRPPGGWTALAKVFAGLQLAEHLLVNHDFLPSAQPSLLLSSLLQSVLLIGLAEELWFRGLWASLWHQRAIPAAGWGSLAFGLYHWPHGGWVILSTAGVGFALAAARLRGASLIGLASVHGLNNWINQSLCPGRDWRLLREAVALLITAAGLGIGLWILQRPKVNPRPLPQASAKST